ncbi:MAG TPA: hypothetical protein VMH02_12425 [Verrucomicrobiae bacterium]|nr:hypothetical protein [Verrucomicrobiae bacterium]
MRFRTILVALVAAALAGWGVRAAAQSPAPSAADAVHKYVAGEDNNFADLQGDPTGAQSDTFTYYQSSVQIPGASACVVYAVKKTGDRFGTCDFDAATEDDAKALFQTWLDNIKAAEPGWSVLQITNGQHLAQLLIEDPQKVHGIYLYAEKSDDGKSYRITTTFGTIAAIER